MSDHKTLAEAMHAIMQEVGYVQKTGKFSGGGASYKFAGEADFIAAIRPAMIKHGVVFSVSSVDNYNCVPVMNGNGKPAYHVTGIWNFTLRHVSSSSEIRVCGVGEGHDSLDKASYKAATGALKYALRQTFIIETGDDPDKPDESELKRQEEEKRNKAEKWASEYIAKMTACKSLGELIAIKNDDKSNRVLKALEESHPDLRGQVSEAGKQLFEQMKGKDNGE